MSKNLLRILLIFNIFPFTVSSQTELIERQGQVSFFSYTSVENIQATNNQVLSILNTTSGEIAVRILMRAFVFEKSLMHQHFNESYIESDLYPEATFTGKITDFDPELDDIQTRIIEGDFTLRNITKPFKIKAKIRRTEDNLVIAGNLEVLIKDYDIKVPALLAPNISDKIEITFNFKYARDEK